MKRLFDYLQRLYKRTHTQKIWSRHKQKSIKRESKKEKWFRVEEERFANKEKNDTS